MRVLNWLTGHHAMLPLKSSVHFLGRNFVERFMPRSGKHSHQFRCHFTYSRNIILHKCPEDSENTWCDNCLRFCFCVTAWRHSKDPFAWDYTVIFMRGDQNVKYTIYTGGWETTRTLEKMINTSRCLGHNVMDLPDGQAARQKSNTTAVYELEVSDRVSVSVHDLNPPIVRRHQWIIVCHFSVLERLNGSQCNRCLVWVVSLGPAMGLGWYTAYCIIAEGKWFVIPIYSNNFISKSWDAIWRTKCTLNLLFNNFTRIDT
jgi:hypothetical protein